MRRVVVTGMGIVSSIGNNTQEVVATLREAKSGISRADDYAELGFRCQVQGAPTLDPADSVDRRAMRFLGDGAAWNHVAMEQAIRDSGARRERHLQRAHRHHHRLGRALDAHHRRGGRYHAHARAQARRPVRGAEGDVVDRVGDALHLVQDQGRQLFDLLGLRDLHPLHRQRRRDRSSGASRTSSSPAAARSSTGRCRCCSTRWARCRPSSTPRRQKASRAYDVDRDGFVIAGGAGMVVLEELEHAKARGAKIYAEIVGYGATSDGYDMVAPSGEGAARCMSMALATVQGADRLHQPARAPRRRSATSRRSRRSARCSAPRCPPISATKSLTGHSLGAAGAQEAIYSLLMMQNGFICESANIENLDPGLRRHADRARAQGRRQARRRAVELLRLRRHQCVGGVQAIGCVMNLSFRDANEVREPGIHSPGASAKLKDRGYGFRLSLRSAGMTVKQDCRCRD